MKKSTLVTAIFFICIGIACMTVPSQSYAINPSGVGGSLQELIDGLGSKNPPSGKSPCGNGGGSGPREPLHFIENPA